MRIQKLEIHNFRGFANANIEFPKSNVSVFIGTNGQGKSTVLDLIAIHLNLFVSRIAKSSSNSSSTWNRSNDVKVVENDIKIGSTETFNSIFIELNSIIPTPKIQEKQVLRWSTSLNIYEIGRVSRFLEHHPTWVEALQNRIKELRELEKQLFDFTDKLYSQVKEKEDINIPLLVYYQSNRTVFGDISVREKPNRYFIKQFEAYDNAFVKKTNDFDDFAVWFRKEEDKENELKVREENFKLRNFALEVVRTSIERFFSRISGSKYKNLRVAREDSQYKESLRRSSREPFSASLVISKNDEELKIEQLSDGEKNLLLLVSDIARRLAIANPKSDNPLNGIGIVLIDELELHLHPTWQKEVLKGLYTTFPNLQFIVTTHSPLVLANLDKNVQIFGIQRLKTNEIIVTPHNNQQFNPYGSLTSRVLRLLMKTNDRPKDVEDLFNKYEQAIDDNNLDEAERIETQLKTLIDPNDPDILQGSATIEAKKLLQEI